MIYCDNNCCEHNNNKTCVLKDTYIVDDYCVSRQKRNDTDNYKQLMQAPFLIVDKKLIKLGAEIELAKREFFFM